MRKQFVRLLCVLSLCVVPAFLFAETTTSTILVPTTLRDVTLEYPATRVLRMGMSGADVRDLQLLLASISDVYPSKKVTGYFGPKTEEAVRRFQTSEGIATQGTPATTGYGQVGRVTGARIALRALEVTCPIVSSERTTCLKGLYFDVAEKRGTIRALQLMKIQIAGEENFDRSCHEVMHIIGHAGAHEFGSLGASFVAGSADCQNGYYHGVVEEYVGGKNPNSLSAETLRGYCSELPGVLNDATKELNCAHGLGHALVYMYHKPLSTPLLRCADMRSDALRAECTAGAFMQYGFVGQSSDVMLGATTTRAVYECTNKLADRDGCWLTLAAQTIANEHVSITPFCDQIESAVIRQACTVQHK